MRHVFGVANNGPLAIQQMIEAYAETKGKKVRTQVLPFDGGVDEKASVILVMTLQLFTRNLAALMQTRAVVFVFDAPHLLEYIKPITILDVADKKRSYVYSFKTIEGPVFNTALGKALKREKPLKVKKETLDLIPNMLGEQLRTVFSPIQEYVYGIRNTDQRLHYQRAIYMWLVKTADLPQLRKVLLDLHGNPKREPVALTRLIDALSDEKFVKAKGAFAEAFASKVVADGKKKKAVNYKKLGAKFGVDPFDLRYALKSIRKFGTFQEINKDANQLYKEMAAAGKAKKAKQEAEEEMDV